MEVNCTGPAMRSLRVLIGSDYHCTPHLLERALEQIPSCDWYINCGDFCSQAGAQPQAGKQGFHPKGKHEVDLLRIFLTQVDQLGKPWIFVPGNHDPSASVLAPLAGEQGIIATETTLITLLGLRVLLVPWTPPCGWNWTLTSSRLKEILATHSQTQADVVITHAPPRGILDEKSKWYHRRTPTLKPLVEAIQPRYYFCGHMHYDGGKQITQGNTLFVNAAVHNLILEVQIPETQAAHSS